jgi:D-sedoheptulose 7-phosphate isomerase
MEQRTSAEQTMRSYMGRLVALFETVDGAALDRVVQLLEDARSGGKTVFLAGNGGSAATAAHWANDLNKATKGKGADAMRVVNLTDNIPWLTALANDEGYERVFREQVDNLAVPGDLLVVISASGNSANLIQAVELARSRAVTSAALLGFDGGALRGLVDVPLLAATEVGAYGLAESCHSLLCDIITECLILSAPLGNGAAS